MKRGFLGVLLLVAATFSPVWAGEAGTLQFDDPRVKQWTALSIAGNIDALRTAVESDLRGASPHPLAPAVWTEIFNRPERLGLAFDVLRKDPRLATAVGKLPRVVSLVEQNDFATLFAEFAPSRVAAETDYWLLVNLAWAAEEAEDVALQTEYLLLASERYPVNARVLWMLLEAASGDQRAIPAITRAISAGGALAGSPAGEFLRRFQPFDRRHLADWRFAFVDWSAAHPDDASALEVLGYLEYERENFEVAADRYLGYLKVFPLYNTPRMAAKLFSRIERHEDARHWTRVMSAELDADPARHAARADFFLAEGAENSGWVGRARQLIADSANDGQLDARMGGLLGRIEAKHPNRQAYALDAYRDALAKAPDNAPVLAGLINVHLSMKRIDRALQICEEALGGEIRRPRHLHEKCAEAATKGSDAAQAQRVVDAGLARYPKSRFLRAKAGELLRQAGRNDEVRRLAETLVQELPRQSWTAIGLLVDLQPEGERAAFAETLARHYPSARTEVLKAALSRVDREADKRAAADRLVAAFPDDPELLRYRMSFLENEKRYRDALGAYETLLARGLHLTRQERRELYEDIAWLYEKLHHAGELSDAKDVGRFRELTTQWAQVDAGSPRYLWLRGLAHLLADEVVEAKAALDHSARLNPDDTIAFAYLREAALRDDHDKAPGIISRRVERDPYDGSVLQHAADLATFYFGAPITALQYMRWIAERDPDRLNARTEARAKAALGVSDALTRDYQQATGVASSQRYVDWFTSSRRKAIEEDSGTLSFTAPFEVKIIRADGMELVLREHPRSGKTTYVRLGPAYYEARYESDGRRLTGLRNSLGDDLSIAYDAHGQIEKIVRKGGDELKLEYNAQARPTRLSIAGVGEIDVSYDAAGEIESVNSPQGTKMALRVTRVMQELLTMARGVNADGVEQLLREGRDDPQVDRLRAQREQTRDPARRSLLGLQLAERLVEALGMNPGYRDEAEFLLDELIAAAGRVAKPAQKTTGIHAVGLKHRLIVSLHPSGLQQADYLEAVALEQRLLELRQQGGDRKVFEAVAAQIQATPAKLLPTARWLPVSDFINPGYWRAYSRSELLPAKFSSARLQSLLLTRKGDLVAGSTSGFSLRRRGFWHWYALPANDGRLIDAADGFEPAAHHNVTALAETDDEALWFGTGNGVYRLAGLDGTATVWRTPKQGLPTPSVLQVLPLGNGVLALGAQAVSRIDPASPTALAIALPDGAVAAAIALLPRSTGSEQDFAVATNRGVFLRAGGKWRKLFDQATQDIHYAPTGDGESGLFALAANRVYAIPVDGGAAMLLPGQQEIVSAGAVRGLADFTDGQSASGLGIHTDSGLSVLREGIVEHTRLDFGLTDRTPDVRAVAARNGSLAALTDQDVLVFEKHNVRHYPGRVDRIRVDDASKTVYFISDGELRQLRDGEMGVPHNALDAVDAFDLTKQGELVFNLGNHIVRRTADGESRELFEAAATMNRKDANDELVAESVKDILIASSGETWVLTSRAVFRHRDGQTSEYGWYRGDQSFPFPSDMLYRIHELNDGSIVVVASAEDHRLFDGTPLTGGLAVFDGTRFIDRKIDHESWFIHARTPVDPDHDILGTNFGFAELRNGRIRRMEDTGNRSYEKLKQKQPALFLGTGGIRLGDETLLFGSAGGLVGWHRGEWFAADRLNRLLPGDARFASRGGRTIHDLAADAEGRIYVGTDIGLLVYSGADAEGVAFLRSNLSPDAALTVSEDRKRVAEADRYLESLPDGSRSAALRDELQRLKADVTHLSEAIANPSAVPPVVPVAAGGVAAAGQGPTKDAQVPAARPAPTDLRKVLRQREREVQSLMARIHSEDPAFHRMLDLKPFDLQAVRATLGPGDVVLQPLPLRNSLILHVVTRDGFDAREVHGVGREQLFQRAARLQQLLDAAAAGELRSAQRIRPDTAPAVSGREEIEGLLDWFYQVLIVPIEGEIGAADRLLYSGTGTLNYLPIAALTKRGVSGERRYLLEAFPRLSVTTVPSLYVLQLAGTRTPPGGAGPGVVVGNPTADLDNAEAEAREVGALIGGNVISLIREKATKQAFVEAVDGARWVHLAMHGLLDSSDTYGSALVFAGKEKLTLLEVMSLPLAGVESAVLSACESGMGRSGDEYTTLAWSFANAGVPTVVASLWQVPDAPTRELMNGYYRELSRGVNPQVALASAQRTLLARYRAEPEAWSAFVALGK